ncbi:hypothetical protein [Xylanimonas ulmi]|uniref:Uncharacterized protein n=1 Tax=Xylanimonas ulmi TaxID=228973 RepID=A0A4Q7M7Z1_9MICO|nr:hypothetical protein [Xylanibacterium ulmi]RZS62249.1 hypothetical protein EV386_2574 [Xylanibacterium ulmi]
MRLTHICESCGRTEVLDEEQAHSDGWDYPPRMGTFGVISPRTCPNCAIDTTVWWAIAVEHTTAANLTDHQRAVVERILCEPATILAGDARTDDAGA